MSDIMIFEEDSQQVEVRLEGETVWLTQKQMAELFEKNVRTINEHLRNVFREGELEENSVIRKFRITAADGKSYETTHYDLDVIRHQEPPIFRWEQTVWRVPVPALSTSGGNAPVVGR